MSLEESSCANTPLFGFDGLVFPAKVLWVFEGNQAYFDVAVFYGGNRVRLQLWQTCNCTVAGRNLNLSPGDMLTVRLGKWMDGGAIIECTSLQCD